jgi:hypothetical protein
MKMAKEDSCADVAPWTYGRNQSVIAERDMTIHSRTGEKRNMTQSLSKSRAKPKEDTSLFFRRQVESLVNGYQNFHNKSVKRQTTYMIQVLILT